MGSRSAAGLAGRRRSVAELLQAAREGDRGALGRLLSVLERGGEPARQLGRLVFPLCSGPDLLAGLTGPPGSGKSTIANGLVREIRGSGRSVGVLAVDPSSPLTGGAFLGDRVRMQEHATDPQVFVRSMASRGSSGGLSLAAPGAVRLMAAAGLGVVLLETVGVGQLELEVAQEADTTVLVVAPGWGDEVQAGKAGLLEVADILVVNKADLPGAQAARRDLEQALDMAQAGSSEGSWRPPVLLASAAEGEGIGELWAAIEEHGQMLDQTGERRRRRELQLLSELKRLTRCLLEANLDALENGEAFRAVRADLLARRLDPYDAADRILAALGAQADKAST
jgi:LAO/AO transport system kinase